MAKTVPDMPRPPGIDHERLEGLVEIRRAIDPEMTSYTFYKYWRRYLDPILIERTKFSVRGENKPRYFTYRRLLYAMVLQRGRV